MRSKTLLFSNILATLYSTLLLCIYVTPILAVLGGLFAAGEAMTGTQVGEILGAFGAILQLLFSLIEWESSQFTFLYVFVILVAIHILTFTIGSIMGWVAYARRKSSGAKLAAVIYLIGTIAYPIYLFFGLPIVITTFIGAKRQKTIVAA